MLLLLVSRDREVMGEYVNRKSTTIALYCAAALIIALNLVVIAG